MNKKNTHIKAKSHGLTLGIPIDGSSVRVYSKESPRGFYQWTISPDEINNLINRLQCNMVEACIEALLDRDALIEQEDGTYLLRRTYLKQKKKMLDI